MKFERVQGGCFDNLETSKSNYYKRAFAWTVKNVKVEGEIIDPFARYCKWGTITNDIDSNMPTDYHLDALDFLKIMKTNSAKILLFDPPFSERQASRYEGGITNLYTKADGTFKKIMNECDRIIKPGGILIKLGYNSSRPSKNFELIKLDLVNFGGSRNDVIVSYWVFVNNTLGGFE